MEATVDSELQSAPGSKLSAVADKPVETVNTQIAVKEIPSIGIEAALNKAEMIKIYQENIQRFKFCPRTLFYADDKLYETKLEQFCSVLSNLLASGQIDPDNHDDRLLDIGCGYGSFFQMLKSLPGRAASLTRQYKGIDIVPEFIKHAQEIYDPHGLFFQEMDLEQYEEEASWCILLGVVNSVPEPEELVRSALKKCKKGLLVDFNDINKGPQTKFHKFDINAQRAKLQLEGAKQVEIFDQPDRPWTVLLAKK